MYPEVLYNISEREEVGEVQVHETEDGWAGSLSVHAQFRDYHTREVTWRHGLLEFTLDRSSWQIMRCDQEGMIVRKNLKRPCIQ